MIFWASSLGFNAKWEIKRFESTRYGLNKFTHAIAMSLDYDKQNPYSHTDTTIYCPSLIFIRNSFQLRSCLFPTRDINRYLQQLPLFSLNKTRKVAQYTMQYNKTLLSFQKLVAEEVQDNTSHNLQ